ncbi:hypothetical protein N4T77_19870 [Clostridium sp. CX1]|uniref:Hydrogenase maturation nickel metallochaperone HypA n=1 Tax=Clostridium tanneri TaxID=3037988 RepID=A0ABU4JYU5_9CLOT|nr:MULTISPECIES: hypothetical protein [unclassified Clostridium]MCT8978840.1 hypothetical protein [Clostridium sp. CX1]MDW8803108.1 hypothetical protein [Clostridium sp. A1-XYC3]
MHDTILLNKISTSLQELCRNHNIKRIGRLSIIVDENSHLNSSNLYEHLRECNKSLVGEWTNIIVEKDQLDSQVAILHSIEGEK